MEFILFYHVAKMPQLNVQLPGFFRRNVDAKYLKSVLDFPLNIIFVCIE